MEAGLFGASEGDGSCCGGGRMEGESEKGELSPDINTIRCTKTDDLSARLRLDKVVDFAVGDEILMAWILGKVGKLQIVKISRVGILGILLVPKVFQNDRICSR